MQEILAELDPVAKFIEQDTLLPAKKIKVLPLKRFIAPKKLCNESKFGDC